MGYVTVDCPGTRIVLIDTKPHGTNRDVDGQLFVLDVEDGLHRFSLEGGHCTPPSMLRMVENTSGLAPLRIVFT